MKITLRLNGRDAILNVGADEVLATTLREKTGLMATKVACGIGRCGACSVMMDGRLVNSCLVLAWKADGAEIVSGEGLDDDPQAAIVRQALAEENAFQCGYCAPGFTMALTALLKDNPAATEADIRAGLSGNICRCTGYHSIMRGALLAAERLRGGEPCKPEN